MCSETRNPECNLRNTKEASYLGFGDRFSHHLGSLGEVFGLVLVLWRRFLASFSCLGGGFWNHVVVSGASGCRKPS